MTINHRLQLLREQMQMHQVDAYIIPSCDAHSSEYLTGYWQGRQWLSGFNGTAGTLVVTGQQAALWTDGRYVIQASQQLEGSDIGLFQTRLPDSVRIGHWLRDTLPSNAAIAVDGRGIATTEARNIAADFGVTVDALRADLDLLSPIWPDRPPLPDTPLFIHEDHYAGLSRLEKVARLRRQMQRQQCDWHLLTSLDDIAWLLNIRGSDVPFCPLVMAFCLVGPDSIRLFIDPAKVPPAEQAVLTAQGIALCDYPAIYQLADDLPEGAQVLVDPGKLNLALMQQLGRRATAVEGRNPTTDLKAVKNPVEIAHFHECLRRDGLVISKFGQWLDDQVPRGSVTELNAEQKLIALRSEYDTYRGDSFRTIAGYQAHGAMMHYGATEASNARVGTRGLFLVDSGGLFLNGTTDITRTYSFGDLSDRQREDYTLVLRGFIGLARARFRRGTRGTQLEVLARGPLWQEGLDYACGSGHGVGFFLNVHEGPQGFSQQMLDVPFEPGMILTNEPGIYRDGEHGVRIENMMLVVEDQTTEHGEFCRFEQLTLAPINLEPVLRDRLTYEEIDWLNDYHRRVRAALSPDLTGAELTWLETQTRPL